MLRKFLALLTITAFFCLPVSVFAQSPDVPDSPCDPAPQCGEDTNPLGCTNCIPIDGGMSFLIAAGVAFGGKKAFDLRKKR